LARSIHIAALFLTATMALSVPAMATQITGIGSAFFGPIVRKWYDVYKLETGTSIDLNYESVGNLRTERNTFSASDKPLRAEELKQFGLIQFPIAMRGVVPAVNLEGIAPGELVLDGPVLAKIFLGEIARWDEPAIARLNPGVKLPSLPVTAVHRSDGSGVTAIFTAYLSKVSADWKSRYGERLPASIDWPAGIGWKGNEGVASAIAQTNGAIGYVEYQAGQTVPAYVKLVNKSGKAVSPGPDAFAAAASAADWATPGFNVILADQPGEAAWPVVAVTFILMSTSPRDDAAAREALKFFAWVYANGGRFGRELGYVPMPASVAGKAKALWAAALKDASGKPLYGAPE
jgi:phosphate transport system substrate-binding protein